MEDFAVARTRMIDSQLRTENVTDYGILAAMGAVPRERFVPAAQRPLAYLDRDIPLDAGDGVPRYLMEPAPFARLVQLADLQPTDRVLIVGAGTGYSAAVVARLVETVVALESDARLAGEASALLADLEVANATVVTGPLEGGHSPLAPYDAILIEGAVEVVPPELLAQLGDAGSLIAIVGVGRAAIATVFARSGEKVGRRAAFDAAIHPLPGFRKPPAFVF
jgi:protein-L-isoaspartate(D-aspartate) O-methyltransferase